MASETSQHSQSSLPKSPKSSKASHSKISSINAAEKPSEAQGGAGGGESSEKSSQPQAALPDFIIRRNQLFDELKKKHDADMLQKDRLEIEVILELGMSKDGKLQPPMSMAAKAWESTPGSFLRHVDKEFSADVVVAKVNGKELWDLDRPLEYSCRLSYLPFTSAQGRNVFWHSSAHVLGEAAEYQYNCLLSHGPPVEQGFFYDMAIAGG